MTEEYWTKARCPACGQIVYGGPPPVGPTMTEQDEALRLLREWLDKEGGMDRQGRVERTGVSVCAYCQQTAFDGGHLDDCLVTRTRRFFATSPPTAPMRRLQRVEISDTDPDYDVPATPALDVERLTEALIAVLGEDDVLADGSLWKPGEIALNVAPEYVRLTSQQEDQR